jgi:predicted metalloprotease with PDZ domain
MARSTALVVLALLLPSSAFSLTADYRVHVPTAEATTVLVEARFELESDVIGMLITSSPELVNGTADLVDGLVVMDDDGRPLQSEALGNGDWRLVGGEVGQAVLVQYRVRLEHDQFPWGPGIDEVAYRTAEGLFFTGSALFIFPGFDMADGARVRFDLPVRWKASLPWTRDGDYAAVPSALSLVRNCLFLGTHNEQTVTFGEFNFTMVIGGDLWNQRQLFVDAMEPVLPAARQMFGGMPRENRYLVVFNRGNRSDGGAFAASYSMLIKGTVNESSSVIWGHGIAHEVIHFWNGHTITPASYHEEWLKEGFTDYLTILVRSRSGLDPRERVYRKLENSMRRYLLSKMLLGADGNIREAGKQKHRNRMYVYGGGTLVGFALDVRIRQATGNAKGIEDFMGALYAEFGTADRKYDYEDVVRIAGAVSSEDQSGFLGRYVDGAELLDVTPYVTAIGMQLDTMMDEFYLSVRPDASPEQLTIAGAIFDGTRTSDTGSR